MQIKDLEVGDYFQMSQQPGVTYRLLDLGFFPASGISGASLGGERVLCYQHRPGGLTNYLDIRSTCQKLPAPEPPEKGIYTVASVREGNTFVLDREKLGFYPGPYTVLSSEADGELYSCLRHEDHVILVIPGSLVVDDVWPSTNQPRPIYPDNMFAALTVMESHETKARYKLGECELELRAICSQDIMAGEKLIETLRDVGTAFGRAMAEVGQMCYNTSRAHGFWELPNGRTGRNEAESIALMHSELSEWLEAIRSSKREQSCAKLKMSQKIVGYTEAEEEAADLMIRLLDQCYGSGYRLAEAVMAKMRHNASRPIRHGRAF